MILHFNGEYRFLSNFWPAWVMYEGVRYPSVEHAYQAAKTEDKAMRERIRSCGTAGYAKRMGRMIVVRPGWDNMKYTVMALLVKEKFTNTPELGAMLLATGNQDLIEGNNWGDTYWGVCDGVGLNKLGQILMGVREQLRRELS